MARNSLTICPLFSHPEATETRNILTVKGVKIGHIDLPPRVKVAGVENLQTAFEGTFVIAIEGKAPVTIYTNYNDVLRFLRGIERSMK